MTRLQETTEQKAIMIELNRDFYAAIASSRDLIFACLHSESEAQVRIDCARDCLIALAQSLNSIECRLFNLGFRSY